MNGISLARPASAEPAAISRFARSSVSLFERIGELDSYAKSVVRRTSETLGFDTAVDIYVGEYLAAVHRSDLRCDDAFFALLFEFALDEGAVS